MLFLRYKIFLVMLCCASLHLPTFAQEFRRVADEQLFVIETDEGRIYIELASEFAPKHVQRIKQLSANQTYQNTLFYRVVEGFVAQGGPGGTQPLSLPPLALEAAQDTKDLDYTLVQTNDLFAPFTAFSGGFGIALNADKSEFWLTHCPGTVAMARSTEPDSATSDFYITIGQAPRYLDKIMTIFGRVVYGMDVVQRTRRGVIGENSTFDNENPPTQILNTFIASKLPEQQRPVILVEQTQGEMFEQKLAARKNRTHPFFFEKPPAVLDVCQVPLTVQFAAPVTSD